MSRGIGVMEVLAGALRGAEPLLAVLTQLGDIWFLTLLALVSYWFADRVPLADWNRRRGLRLVAVALLAFAATHLLKGAVGLPRPAGAGVAVYAAPGPLDLLYESAATGSGYGFPSGHALGTAAVYGTLALTAREGWRERRFWVALGLVALVSGTRIALGVHFLVDVVAGAAVGFAIAAVAVRADAPARQLFAAAIAAVLVRPYAAPADLETVALLGATSGALLVTVALDPVSQLVERQPRRRMLTVYGVGAATLLAAPAFWWLGWLTASVGAAALGGSLVALALPLAPWVGKKRDDGA